MGSSSDTWTLVSNKFGLTYKNNLDTFNKLGYKAKIKTHTTSYIN